MPLRLGLCCQFLDAPIRFRVATHRHLSTLAREAAMEKLAGIALDNADALARAVERCAELGVGAFRITSQVLPLATHPESGYALADLDARTEGEVTRRFAAAREAARRADVRLTFHPDQFVVLNSEQPRVVESSLREMALQGELAELVGADVLTLHAGSSAGGLPAALDRLERGLDRLAELSPAASVRVALENDDRRFAPADILPLCERLGVPMVYDAHHHRCHPDGLPVAEVTARAVATWRGREPSFHLSSPRGGWAAADPRPHHDFVDPADLPDAWLAHAARASLTVDVEAKAKERAVLALRDAIRDALPTPATR